MAAPDFRRPEYGLSPQLLQAVARLRSVPAWQRRKMHREKQGARSRFIYKYLPIDLTNELSIKKVRDLVVESTLYLSSPSEFNDPYDFRARILLVDDPVERRKYFRSTGRYLLGEGNDFEPGIRGRERKLDAMVSKAMAKSISDPQFTSRVLDTTREKYGVFCFSEDPRGLLSWAMYAAGHSGVCLQFEVTADPAIFMLALKVNYRKEYPVLVWPTNKDQALEKIVLNKGLAWENEREVRYVSQVLVKGSLPFDGNALRGIILGERFPDGNLSFLEGLLRERRGRGLKDLLIYQARCRRYEYGMSVFKSDQLG